MDNEKIIAFFVKDIGKAKARYLAKCLFARTFFDQKYDKTESPEVTLMKIYDDLENSNVLINGMEEFLSGLLDELAEKYGDVACDAMYYIEECEQL